MSEVKRLLINMKKSLKPKGKILIFTLNSHNNELPSFALMSIRLSRSLDRDKKIFKAILKKNLIS